MDKIIPFLEEQVGGICYRSYKYCVDEREVPSVNYEDNKLYTLQRDRYGETDTSLKSTKDIYRTAKQIEGSNPLFRYFLDGSRRIYKIDDIELAYLPYITHLVRTPLNRHHFTYLTSGFTAVTNSFMLGLMDNLSLFLNTGAFDKKFEENYFDKNNIEGKNGDVMHYLDGVAAHSRSIQNEALSRRLLRNIVEIYEEENQIYLLPY